MICATKPVASKSHLLYETKKVSLWFHWKNFALWAKVWVFRGARKVIVMY